MQNLRGEEGAWKLPPPIRPPLAAAAVLGLVNKEKKIIVETIRKEKICFLLIQLKRVVLDTYLFRIN